MHQEILVGTFAVGTLAFVVSHAWNVFLDLVVKIQIKNAVNEDLTAEDKKRDNKELLVVGMATIVITYVAVLIVLFFMYMDWLHHKPKK